ncbi:hypothetical protein [Pedobacter duraquae]|uniref:Lipoprotein n=1 Tax=Pedobacter duraquae TaxID=425511 RepID=A0A4V6PSC7_9SPHI|nr:hypothetical protein [Pedobacter duraquae]TDO20829.1 hypothetical protein CLV32_3463 [Pedobacter duraquae]
MSEKSTTRLNSTIQVTLMTCFSILLLGSCVSLKTPKRSDLVALKAPSLIGRYPVKVDRTIRVNSTKDTVISTPIWYFLKNSEGADTAELAKATHVELTLADKTHVTSKLYQDKTLLKSEVIKGKLKNGYFRKKHDLSITGVPPFYWSMNSNKIQFGLGKNGQLYIDQADETNGSILIIMAGTPGFTSSYTVLPYVNK